MLGAQGATGGNSAYARCYSSVFKTDSFSFPGGDLRKVPSKVKVKHLTRFILSAIRGT